MMVRVPQKVDYCLIRSFLFQEVWPGIFLLKRIHFLEIFANVLYFCDFASLDCILFHL